jgi:Mg/Co/Ni transporter MgtE
MLVLLESLSFYRNVRVGTAVGALLAALLYLVRTLELLGPVIDTRDYPLFGPDVWFLLLAFVLAATSALSVAVALTVAAAVRGAREKGAERPE